jgi:hypothetical protein
VSRDSADAPVRDGARLASRGSVTGAFVLDRARGWWADSRVTITLGSTVTPPPGSAAPPVKVQTRITQRVRLVERREGVRPPD